MHDSLLVDVPVPFNNLFDITYSFFFSKCSCPFNLFFEVSALAVFTDDEHHFISEMLRHNLHDILLSPQFPHNIHFLYQFFFLDWIAEVRFRVSFEAYRR